MHEPHEQYDGPATIDPDSPEPVHVEVTLRGHFEPIDGLFHWYGRIAPDAGLDRRHSSGDTVTVATPAGRAEGRVSDVDTWGRFRISGTGRPPF